ncbi:MAG TPA: tRNA lysidine(34) synthetase TilS [Candidatus Saccharimonadales bacterium]|nr:tRNA lysidine(34) synthetase TilS [Candidatus Saccharimonadales bacterium]
MNIEVAPGKYVVAVSGGVDSVALLHALKNLAGLKLVVAHFDHGIRSDSAEDRRHVQALARQYKLPFVYDRAELGPEASEAAARQARYTFLRKVRASSGAQAIITAHHQDDLLETAILNLVRGTHRKGLSSLYSQGDIVRPLLQVPKQELMTYAKDQGLVWREDSTNTYQRYLRNYVRHSLLRRLAPGERQKWLDVITRAHQLNQETDMLLTNMLHLQSAKGQLDRLWFSGLGHAEAMEVMAAWLRAHGVRDFDRPTLERLVVGAKVSPPGKRVDAVNGIQLSVQRHHLALVPLER